jgi:hypothetical protein
MMIKNSLPSMTCSKWDTPFLMPVKALVPLAHLNPSKTPIQLQMYQSNASVMTERPLLLLVILVPSWTTGLSNQ